MQDKIDYKALRSLAFDESEQVYDASLPLSANLRNLFCDSVVMPDQPVQLPILLSYILIPSGMADIVPVAFLQGDKGSGKSTATILASHVHNSPIQSAATTFAALRNHLNKMRWADAQYMEGERNCILLWDNVNKATLDNEQIYTMLLCGYNRKTDSMNISAGSGENQEFKVFCTKMLSTIHPLFVSSRFDELIRRLIVFKFKQWEKFTDAERAQLPNGFNFDDRLDLDIVDLSILKAKFDEFWAEDRHLSEYISLKKKLKSRKNRVKLPPSIDSHKWTISVDLLVTGIVTGIFNSVEDGIQALGRYWEWNKQNIIMSWGATHKLLKTAIEELTETTDKVNKAAGREVVAVEIQPKDIKTRLNAAYQEGALDIVPNAYSVGEIMRDLGFKLDTSSTGKGNVWVRLK